MKKRGYDRQRKRQMELRSIEPGSPNAVVVVDGDLTFALRLWKRRMKRSGIMQRLYERREYQKPSARKRAIKMSAVHRQQNAHRRT